MGDSPPDSSPDAALEALTRRFAALVRAVAIRVGGQRGHLVADDVEQEVFLSLWKQLKREQIIEQPSSYLYKCAVRETVRLLKAETRQASTPLETLGDGPMAPPRSDPLLADAIAKAIDTLAPDRRRAVEAHLAGFDVADIMRMQGWSYQRARNLIARGMADLRERLQEARVRAGI
jgi:RNA polymerase sigma factor (sigma-70 family)